MELKAQDESLKVLRTKCEELNSKTEVIFPAYIFALHCFEICENFSLGIYPCYLVQRFALLDPRIFRASLELAFVRHVT